MIFSAVMFLVAGGMALAIRATVPTGHAVYEPRFLQPAFNHAWIIHDLWCRDACVRRTR